jgi:hypothetical protein
LYRDEEVLRTIENGRIEVLEPVVAVPRLLGLDTPEVHRVIGVHVGIGFGHVGERVVAQKMLVAPVVASLLVEQRRLLGRSIGGGDRDAPHVERAAVDEVVDGAHKPPGPWARGQSSVRSLVDRDERQERHAHTRTHSESDAQKQRGL